MAFSQNDPAWKSKKLGNGKNLGTIGKYGCYVTAIANMCNWAGKDINPSQVNDFLNSKGWFAPSSPGCNDLVSRDDVPAQLCSNLKFAGRKNWTGPTDMSHFADASDPYVAYIIKIDASPATGVQSHYTLVWSKSGTTDLLIDDSWDGVRKKLSTYGKPSTIIYSAIRFTKQAPAKPVPKPEVPSEPKPTPKPVETPKPTPPTPEVPPTPPVPETPKDGTPSPEVPQPKETLWDVVLKIFQRVVDFLKSYKRT